MGTVSTAELVRKVMVVLLTVFQAGSTWILKEASTGNENDVGITSHTINNYHAYTSSHTETNLCMYFGNL